MIPRTLFRTVRNQRGVALPLALFGLVAVTLMVTTALLTSSTELAISGAQQDATQALYVAEGGLQSYVAERGTILSSNSQATTYAPPGAPSSQTVTITPLFLGETRLSNDTTVRIFSVTSTPVSGGGRTVRALVRQLVPMADPLNLNVTSAMTVAGDLQINGNAFTVDGRSRSCGSSGVEALRYASDSEITFAGQDRKNRFSGTTDLGMDTVGDPVIQNSLLPRQLLASNVLQGSTISEIANRVPSSRWSSRLGSPTYSDSWLAGMLPAGTGGVAVVNADGGTVNISGNTTYTGLLIVINGSVDISGNSVFDGIILVERNFTLSGNVKINGALISLAMDGQNVVANTGDDSAMQNGSVDIRYDRCLLESATKTYAKIVPSSKAPIVRATAGWMEVVR